MSVSSDISRTPFEQLARKMAMLITEATTLRRENEELKRRIKAAESFIPWYQLGYYRKALEGGEW